MGSRYYWSVRFFQSSTRIHLRIPSTFSLVGPCLLKFSWERFWERILRKNVLTILHLQRSRMVRTIFWERRQLVVGCCIYIVLYQLVYFAFISSALSIFSSENEFSSCSWSLFRTEWDGCSSSQALKIRWLRIGSRRAARRWSLGNHQQSALFRQGSFISRELISSLFFSILYYWRMRRLSYWR